MSIKLNDGTILRNLEEQVQYLTNYHDVNQGLAQWGIRVVGQVETDDQLPDPTTYKGEYGDAYAVGTEAPFSFYIFTRAAIVGDSAYWFPFGEISIVGPQGPQGLQGPVGPEGERGSKWSSGTTLPVLTQDTLDGDQFLNTNTGAIYQLITYPNGSKEWKLMGNIQGPQGIQGPTGLTGPQGPQGEQGPQGPQGDVGGFINIWGIVANVGQLPTPASLNNLTVAYLVGASAPYDLWIQVGETSDTAVWKNTGPFNAATAVSVGGIYQNIWDADTKVGFTDYATETKGGVIKTAKHRGVWTLQSGLLELNPASDTELKSRAWYMPVTAGNLDLAIKVGVTTNTETLSDTDKADACEWLGAVKQVEFSKEAGQTGSDAGYWGRAYAVRYTGDQTSYPISSQNNVASIPIRDPDGNFYVGNPTQPYHVITKKYTEDNFVAKTDTTDAPTAGKVAKWGLDGKLYTNDPVNPTQAANKKYVDEQHVVTVFKVEDLEGNAFLFKVPGSVDSHNIPEGTYPLTMLDIGDVSTACGFVMVNANQYYVNYLDTETTTMKVVNLYNTLVTFIGHYLEPDMTYTTIN